MSTTFLNTNLKTSKIGQGLSGTFLSTEKFSKESSVRKENLLLGIEQGMTLIDTAENYGDGLSEILVGEAISGVREKVQIATKFSPENSNFKGVIRAVEGSLHRLKTDYIDLYQYHWPNPDIPFKETFSALLYLKQVNKIREIGVSNFSCKQLSEAISVTGPGQIVSNQVEYNLFDRHIETDLIPFCEKNGIKIIAYSPLDRGRITSSPKGKDTLKNIAQKYRATLHQIALAWIIKNPNIIAIPNTSNKANVVLNSQSMNIKLTDQEFDLIAKNNCNTIRMIDTNEINVSEFGEEDRSVYTNIDQAIQNFLNFVPSPSSLATSLKSDSDIKPVRVVPASNQSNGKKFDLIEGRIRYWAWVIAFGPKVPIPSYLRASKYE